MYSVLIYFTFYLFLCSHKVVFFVIQMSSMAVLATRAPRIHVKMVELARPLEVLTNAFAQLDFKDLLAVVTDSLIWLNLYSGVSNYGSTSNNLQSSNTFSLEQYFRS